MTPQLAARPPLSSSSTIHGLSGGSDQNQTSDPTGIIEQLRGDLTRVISEKIDQEVDFEKTWAFQRLRKTDIYYRGQQMVFPNQFGATDYTATGTPTMDFGSGADGWGGARGLSDYNNNIVKTYGRRYQSILGLRPFYNCKGVPDDPSSDTDRRAAEQAELLAAWLDQKWNIRVKNIELFYWQWKAGTVYLYTPYVADARMFGEVEEPEWDAQPVELTPGGYHCPNCGADVEAPVPASGTSTEPIPPETVCPNCQQPLSDIHQVPPVTASVPVSTGTKKYAASGPALMMCTGYTVTAPFDVKDFDRKPYMLHEYEEDQGTLLQVFGDDLRKLVDAGGNFASQDSSTSRAQGYLSRQQEFSLTAMPRINANSRWTYSRYWLATSMYEYVKDEANRALLYEQFPDGLKAHLVQGKLVRLENENAADVWTCVMPEPADSHYTDPQAWGILGAQDLTTDWLNIMVAYGERGLPTHIVDPDVLDADAINGRAWMPQELIEAKPGTGARLDSAIKTLSKATFPEDMPMFSDRQVQFVENYTGILPPAYGGGERQATAEGQRTMLNQALMQLAVPGDLASSGWAESREKAIRQIAKHAPKSFSIPGRGKSGNPSTSQMVDLDALRAGKWHLEPEVGVPMSWAEKRDQFNAILQQNPAVAHAMGLDSPINAAVARDYLLPGMGNELEVPDEALRDKIMTSVIPQLLQGQPMPDPNGGPPTPSIPPEDFVDDPEKCADLAKQWLIGPGVKLWGTPGYANVVAWGLAQANKVPPPKPEFKPSFAMQLKVEDFSPQVQSELLAAAGIQVDPSQLAPPMPQPMPGAGPAAPGAGQGGPPPGPGGPSPASPGPAGPPQGPMPAMPPPNVGMPPANAMPPMSG